MLQEARELTRRLGVPLVVNDRPDLAVLVEADFVHVGQDDLPGRRGAAASASASASRRTPRRSSTRPRRTTSASGPCTRRRRRRAGRPSGSSSSATPPRTRACRGSRSAASTRRTSPTSSRPGRRGSPSSARSATRRTPSAQRATLRASLAATARYHAGRPLGGRSPVAQLAEHPAVNRRVVGSSPTRGVKKSPANTGLFLFRKSQREVEAGRLAL